MGILANIGITQENIKTWLKDHVSFDDLFGRPDSLENILDIQLKEDGTFVVNNNNTKYLLGTKMFFHYNVESFNDNGLFEWGDLSKIDVNICGNNMTTLKGKGIPQCVNSLNLMRCRSLVSLEHDNPKNDKIKTFSLEDCVSLTSLKGCPRTINRFECLNSPIVSLEGLPKKVDSVVLEKVPITNMKYCPNAIKMLKIVGCPNLTTLEGCCEKTNFFCCSGCPNITTLKGGPTKTKNTLGEYAILYCDNLESLDGAIQKCKRFACVGCKKITSLKGGPQECKIYECKNCDLQSIDEFRGLKVMQIECGGNPKLGFMDKCKIEL